MQPLVELLNVQTETEALAKVRELVSLADRMAELTGYRNIDAMVREVRSLAEGAKRHDLAASELARLEAHHRNYHRPENRVS